MASWCFEFRDGDLGLLWLGTRKEEFAGSSNGGNSNTPTEQSCEWQSHAIVLVWYAFKNSWSDRTTIELIVAGIRKYQASIPAMSAGRQGLILGQAACVDPPPVAPRLLNRRGAEHCRSSCLSWTEEFFQTELESL